MYDMSNMLTEFALSTTALYCLYKEEIELQFLHRKRSVHLFLHFSDLSLRVAKSMVLELDYLDSNSSSATYEL